MFKVAPFEPVSVTPCRNSFGARQGRPTRPKMPELGHGMVNGLTREHVLDELEFLAAVEHALVVEYLSVGCALGHDLDAEEGGATTKGGRDGASAASSLALGEMFRLKGIVLALIEAGRFTTLGRAASIPSDSTGEISLDPPNAAQLQRLLEREKVIASTLDERYIRLAPAVTTYPVFEGDLLDELRRIIVDEGPTHTAALATLRDSLADLASADILRATRRTGDDAFEQRLLDISDRSYALVLAALRDRFAPKAVTSPFLAERAMECLDQVNRALVQRGLLPPFTPA
jgi:hypothetical protein